MMGYSFWLVLVALGVPLLAVFAVLNVEDGTRATRGQFIPWVLIESFVVATAAGLALIRDMGGWVILLGLFATLIALRIQHLAAQRFQDVGQSKWWSLLLTLPVINALVAVVLMVLPSKQTTAPALERGPLHGEIEMSR